MVAQPSRLTVTLGLADDDPSHFDKGLQQEIGTVRAGLAAADPHLTALMRAHDAAGDSGGMWQLGEFVVSLLGAGGIIREIVKATGTYLTAKAGRRVKLKIGDLEAEAHSFEELRDILELGEGSVGRAVANVATEHFAERVRAAVPGVTFDNSRGVVHVNGPPPSDTFRQQGSGWQSANSTSIMLEIVLHDPDAAMRKVVFDLTGRSSEAE